MRLVLASTLLLACSSPSPQPSSAEKIAADDAKGALDHDTALLYYLYAAYDPASLPADYRGDDSHSDYNGTTVFFEIAGRYNQMSATLQAKIAPFLLRPDDPTSFWGQHLPADVTTQSLGTADVRSVTFSIATSSKNRVKVHYRPYLIDASTAQNYADEFDSVWDTEQAVMLGRTPLSDINLNSGNGGDELLDVYLTDKEAANLPRIDGDQTMSGAAGVTIPAVPNSGSCPCPAYIMVFRPIDAGDGLTAMKCTSAHELFHAFQMAFAHAVDNDHMWWAEASASWAVDLVYPSDNCEWRYLEKADSTWSAVNSKKPISGPLNKYVYLKGPQYSAYVWPYYLTRKVGLPATTVGQIWADSETLAPIRVMANLAGWESSFKDFALSNWNQAPVVPYPDAGGPIPIETLVQVPEAHTLSSSAPLTLKVTLPEVSVGYYQTAISDGGGFVHRVTYDLSAFQNQMDTGVQALVTIEGQGTIPVDWSSLDKKSFCRDRPNEKVTNVVLVISNSKTDSGLTGSLPVTVGPPCVSSTGSFNYDASQTRTLDSMGGILPAGSAMSTLAIKSVWNLELVQQSSALTVYNLISENEISFTSMSSLSYTNPQASSMETDNVTGHGKTHDPPVIEIDPTTNMSRYDLFDYDLFKDVHSTLTIRNLNQFEINWEMSRIATQRDYSYSSQTTDVDPMGMTCPATETGVYDVTLPGFRGTVSSCLGTRDDVLVDADGPPHICAPTATGNLAGTFDPKTGLIKGDVVMDDADCNTTPAGNCWDPYSPKAGWVGGTCVNHYHLTFDLQVPPQP